MEEREAIARIKASRDYRYSHYDFVDDTGKAFDMAIRALEKQGSEKRKSEKIMENEESRGSADGGGADERQVFIQGKAR